MYFPLGFSDICVTRMGFLKIFKWPMPVFQILFVAAAYAKTNVISRAWEAAANKSALAIGRRHSARQRRIVPCDLRRASLPVAAAISIMFLDILCSIFYNVS